jgi:hypothetical protein
MQIGVTAAFVASLCMHSSQEMLVIGLRVIDILMKKCHDEFALRFVREERVLVLPCTSLPCLLLLLCKRFVLAVV